MNLLRELFRYRDALERERVKNERLREMLREALPHLPDDSLLPARIVAELER